MTNKFAIEILEQYRERPTLINEIESVNEACWLDESLDMAIKALNQEPVLDKIRAEIKQMISDYGNYEDYAGTILEMALEKVMPQAWKH